MTKAAFIKSGNGLLPVLDDGREIMASIKDGQQVMVNIHSPRNIKHHNLFFSLLKMIVDAGAWDGTQESLRQAVLLQIGYVDVVMKFDGTITYVPKSMKFESMPQEKFNRVFNRALWSISSVLLNMDDWEGLREDVYEAVEGNIGPRVREHNERYNYNGNA